MKITKARIAAALRRAGRQRGIDALAAQLLDDLRKPQLRQPRLVEEAFARQSLAPLATLNAECASADQLTESATAAFQQHPDYTIITSFPGLADLSGARVFGEIGDDRARFTDARSLKACAGSAPVTRASGRSISITRRTGKNDRLNAAASSGLSPASAEPAHHATTATVAEHTATGTQQHRGTCSTASSDSPTTARRPARPMTQPGPSTPLSARQPRPRLDN
ncbi:transposase [Amycolatopsis halotolerans]|uniref:Transposase n=1 Tax=Amycolatopsis halotolerans TaxID=330083 RepID=A0ABV7QAR7_9PSEU